MAVPQSDEHTGIADEKTEKKLESLLDIVNSGFLGLVVPHVVRRIFGANHRAYLPLSALLGALFLLAAHGVSSRLPKDMSAGVVCALCGSPFFLYLLCLRRGTECPREGD